MRLTPFIPLRAPSQLGALFVVLLLLISCKQEARPISPQREPLPSQSTSVKAASTPTVVESPDTQKPQKTTKPKPHFAETRFVFFNLRNYLAMDRRVQGKFEKMAPKPENEIQAVLAILSEAQPDILAVCEMGTRQDAQDLQQRLRAKGLDLPHHYWLDGPDSQRHLALYSRFPITQNDSQERVFYRLGERNMVMQRGILDVTVSINQHPLRLIGAHLKSKREVAERDQAAMRRHEAQCLRQHLDQLHRTEPQANFLLFGDLNDDPQSESIGILSAAPNCQIISLKDKQNQTWTQYWSFQDQYSRFDYVFHSPSLRPQIDFKKSRIMDHPAWNAASDHRALLIQFK